MLGYCSGPVRAQQQQAAVDGSSLCEIVREMKGYAASEPAPHVLLYLANKRNNTQDVYRNFTIANDCKELFEVTYHCIVSGLPLVTGALETQRDTIFSRRLCSPSPGPGGA